MSKSVPAGSVFLLDDPKVSAKRIKSAVTDSEREIRYDPVGKPGVSNLLSILGALTNRAPGMVAAEYEGKGYGDLKGDVADAVVTLLIEPIRTKTYGFLSDKAELTRLMALGAEKARAVARETLKDSFDKIGFVPAAKVD
jgi:tryptophanyl-tRNA synthetase